MSFYEDSMALSGRCTSRIMRHKTRFGDYYSGDVITPHGLVSVYQQDGDDLPITRLDMAVGGRLHMRTYRKAYSPRGITRKAREFAEELVEQ